MPVDVRTSDVGKQRKALHGTRTRPAQQHLGVKSWEKCSSTLGFVVGASSRCCFHNHFGSVAEAVHGGDIFIAGRRDEVLTICAFLNERWATHDQLIGHGSFDQTQLHILNRTLRWCGDGCDWTSRLEATRTVSPFSTTWRNSTMSRSIGWTCGMPRRAMPVQLLQLRRLASSESVLKVLEESLLWCGKGSPRSPTRNTALLRHCRLGDGLCLLTVDKFRCCLVWR